MGADDHTGAKEPKKRSIQIVPSPPAFCAAVTDTGGHAASETGLFEGDVEVTVVNVAEAQRAAAAGGVMTRQPSRPYQKRKPRPRKNAH